MIKIDEFKLKDGRKVDIILPEMRGLRAITDFVNRLTDEDTFLTFTGNHISLRDEKAWLKNALNEIKNEKNYILWAEDNNPSTSLRASKIIGDVSIRRGGMRDSHVGKIGLMVDKEYRKLGLGKYLLELILQKAKQMKIKIAIVECFSDNLPAINLYQKLGFRKYGQLPNGLYRKNKYSDKIEMMKIIE